MATKRKGKSAGKAAASLPKLEVIKRFRDKYNLEVIFEVGEKLEFDDEERVKDLIDRGLVKPVEEICQK